MSTSTHVIIQMMGRAIFPLQQMTQGLVGKDGDILSWRSWDKLLRGVLEFCLGLFCFVFFSPGFHFGFNLCFVVKPAICRRLELLAEPEQGSPP